MSFLEPLFLVGLLALAVPPLIHLMNRRKAVKVPFPALRLLHESNKRTAQSIKVRQWLLMAARILGLLLLVLAMAKPFVLSEQGIAADERLPTANVIVLDDSASMHQGNDWKNALSAAQDHIDKARPWDELALLTTSGRALDVDRLSDKHTAIEQALAELQASELQGHTLKTLQDAASVLKSSELPQRKITLITDASHIAGEINTQKTLDPVLGARTELLMTGGDNPTAHPENLAITQVHYEQDSTDATQWKITASVKNTSKKPFNNIELRLLFGEDILTAGRIETIGAGEETEHTFMHKQETQLTTTARVELVSQDLYPLDDTHHFIFRTRARINALLVNGETSSIADEDEMFFLSRALNPGRSTTEGIIPQIITQERLIKEDLAKFDAVILANVPRLSQGTASKLERYVKSGGGLLFFAGDQIDINAYNSTLKGFLPKPLRAVKEFATREDPDAPVKVTRFGTIDPKHPIFRAFSLPGGETLQSAEVFSTMLFDPTATPDSRTILFFKDNSPALLEKQVEKGRVLFFATSADMEWTSLPIRSAYVPLMQRAVQYLARRSSNLGEKDSRTGQVLQLEVGGLAKERVVINGPLGRDDTRERFVLEPQDGLVQFRPIHAGAYEVWAESDQKDKGTRLEDLNFAVNVPLEESQLERMPEQELRKWLQDQEHAKQGDEASQGTDRTMERRVNIWPKLLFFFTLLLLAETILGTRRTLAQKVFGHSDMDDNQAA